MPSPKSTTTNDNSFIDAVTRAIPSVTRSIVNPNKVTGIKPASSHVSNIAKAGQGSLLSPNSAVSMASGDINHNEFSGTQDYDWLSLFKEISEANNQFNLEQTDKVNAFNALEAQKNRDWQERLSNTAHQREIKDLIAAGLNPVLSSGGQGAITGSGAVASGQKAVADSIYGQGAMNFMQSLMAMQSAENVAKINASAKVTAASMSSSASGYAARLNYASQSNYQRILEDHYSNQNINNQIRNLLDLGKSLVKLK